MYISVTLIAMNDLTDDIFRSKRKEIPAGPLGKQLSHYGISDSVA